MKSQTRPDGNDPILRSLRSGQAITSRDLLAPVVRRLGPSRPPPVAPLSPSPPPPRDLSAAGLFAGAQIGRASFRGRVGQYVQISVVAVSSKKKNGEQRHDSDSNNNE